MTARLFDPPALADCPGAVFEPITAIFARQARSQPDAPFVHCDGKTMTWREMELASNRVARALIDDGFEPGAAAAICAEPSIDYLTVLLGVLKAGGCIVPLPTLTTPDQLTVMARNAGPGAVFLSAAMATTFGETLSAAADVRISVVFGPADGRWQAYRPWQEKRPTAPSDIAIAPGDRFNIIYSSGTTGAPKGIVHDHRARWAMTRRLLALYQPDCVSLVSTPFYSNNLIIALLPTIAAGGTLVLMPKFDARRFLDLAERHRVTHAVLVPAQYQRILDDPAFDRFDLGSFRYKFCGSAPFPPETKLAALSRWPGRLRESYGMTEGMGSLNLDVGAHPDKLHTVGRPVEGADIRIIDDDGHERPTGATGEIVGRSPDMMIGYHRSPDLTRALLWHDAAGQAFFRSGDIGRFDDDGFLTLVGRKKDVIISGGFNIYASDLEKVLEAHEAVAEAAAVAIPSARWGETPLAVVVARPGMTMDPEIIRDWANARLGAVQRIAAVVMVAELPRNALGKVLKAALRERFAT